MKYRLVKTTRFQKKTSRLVSRNEPLRKKISKTLKTLQKNPFFSGLKTHKVQSRIYGIKYSSRVSKDVRIIWNFDEQNKVCLLLLDLGSHSGSGKVYH